MSTNETQVGGTHYRSEYQHWDFVIKALGGRYLEGCATKYIARWRKKNGVQDLEKAQHYILKLRELYETHQLRPIFDARSTGVATVLAEVDKFCSANGLANTSQEYSILSKLATWREATMLESALVDLATLLLTAQHEERMAQARKAGFDLQDNPCRVEGAETLVLQAGDVIKMNLADNTFELKRADEPDSGYVDQG